MANLCEAYIYKSDVVFSRNHRRATVDDLGRAVLYEHSAAQIASAAVIGPAVAPPWFAPVQQQLNNMEQQLHDMQDQINNTQNQLDRIDARGARAINATNKDGSIVPFEVVLFVNGDNPTSPPHNLPALTSIQVIDNLQGHQLNQYLAGYGLSPAHQLAVRRDSIKDYIGYRRI